MLRTMHLFAGAGGGLLADLILCHSPIHAVEWDPYACRVLRARFPNLNVIEGDIRQVDFSGMADIDAICAGFPCTDISAANPNGKGIDGERSGLYREVMRAIDDIRPAWVFLENSPRIRTKGRHIVIADLVARGYSWRDGILGAADVGAPHRRDRWWLLAHRNGHDGAAGVAIDGGRNEQRDTAARDGRADLAHSDRERRNGRPTPEHEEGRQSAKRPPLSGGTEKPQYLANSMCDRPQDAVSWGSAGRTTGQEGETAAGCGERSGWWKTERGLGRVVDGLASRAHGHWSSRIKCLGNGQVPLCAAAAWRLLGGP